MPRGAEVSIDGVGNSIPLSDLRWLMDQVKILPDDASVSIRYSKAMDQRERDSWTLTARIQTPELRDLSR